MSEPEEKCRSCFAIHLPIETCRNCGERVCEECRDGDQCEFCSDDD